MQEVAPGARLLRAWPLLGGASARVHALEAELEGGGRLRCVVHRYGQADLGADPDAAVHELALLRVLHAAGLPVPQPLLADPAGELLGTPCLVMRYVDGRTPKLAGEIRGCLGELASALARLHRVACAPEEISFLRDLRGRFEERLRQVPRDLDEAIGEGDIRRALAAAWPPRAGNPPAILHGDFWPGNTIWRAGRLLAVIDWEDAGVGDPLIDVANARLEIAMAAGLQAADEFTRHYLRRAPHVDVSALPTWDLCAALRPAGKMAGWGLPAQDLRAMQAGLRAFAAAAGARLSP